MLGLPSGDNMRCKLLLGLSVSSANRSNPSVADQVMKNKARGFRIVA